MNKKGFTLIELLGVFLLLALILLLAIPSLTGVLKKQRENNYQKYLDDLYLATEAYVQSNEFNLEKPGETIYVKIEDLVKAKLLKSTIIDPNTNEKVNLNHYIQVIVNDDHTYHYAYMSEMPKSN